MTFDVSKLKISTKSLIAFVLALGSLLQIPQVGDTVFAFAKYHPHFAAVLAVVTAVVGLLHNPQIESILGIKQTVQQEQTAVDGEVKTVTNVVTEYAPVAEAVAKELPAKEAALVNEAAAGVDVNAPSVFVQGAPYTPPTIDKETTV